MSIALPNYHPSKPEEELPSLAASSIPDDESDLPPTDLILTVCLPVTPQTFRF